MSRTLVLSALLLLAIAPLGAQTAEPAVGSRIRVSLGGDDGRRFEGRLLAHAGDSIVIAVEEGITRRFALRDVSSMERSLGRSRSAGAGRGAAEG